MFTFSYVYNTKLRPIAQPGASPRALLHGAESGVNAALVERSCGVCDCIYVTVAFNDDERLCRQFAQ